MWLMLQEDTRDEYVIATGRSHSVQEFVERAFAYVGLDWQDYVVMDEKLYRPSEVPRLRGDFSKARRELGWEPTVQFEDLVKMMVEADLEDSRTNWTPLPGGR